MIMGCRRETCGGHGTKRRGFGYRLTFEKVVLEIAMSLPGRALRKVGLDRNPLRRTSDRVEAWVTVLLLATLVLVMPYIAWRAGRASYTTGIRAERVQQEHRYRTEAVLLPDPDGAGGTRTGPGDTSGGVGRDAGDPAAPSAGDSAVPGRGTSAPARVRVYAYWRGVDGTQHHGYVSAVAPARPGTRVPVWTTGAGDLTTPPQRRFETVVDAATIAALAAGALAGVLAAVRFVVRRVLDVRRLAQWQEAWWRYEPRWTGRHW
jgi:hypothetical protein